MLKELTNENFNDEIKTGLKFVDGVAADKEHYNKK